MIADSYSRFVFLKDLESVRTRAQVINEVYFKDKRIRLVEQAPMSQLPRVGTK